MTEPTAVNARKSSFAWAWILGGAIVLAAYILATHRSAPTAANPPSGAGSPVANAMASPPPQPAVQATANAAGAGKGAADSSDKASASNSRLAPPGTFYMVDYVSAKTPKGVVGFEPGRTVKLVEVHREQGTLTVTDGQYQADVQPSQLTNDMDIADLGRDRDAVSQHKLADYQATALRAYQATQKKTDENYSKDVANSNAEIKANSAVGAASEANPLNAAPSPTNTVVTPGVVYGSPYSYFAPNAVNAPRAVIP